MEGELSFVIGSREGRGARTAGCCCAGFCFAAALRHHRACACVRGGIKGESVDLLVWSVASLAPPHKRQSIEGNANQRPLPSPKCLLRFPTISGGDRDTVFTVTKRGGEEGDFAGVGSGSVHAQQRSRKTTVRQRGASSRSRLRARSTPICMRTEPGLFGNAPLTHGELHKAANHDSQIKHRSGSSNLTAYVRWVRHVPTGWGLSGIPHLPTHQQRGSHCMNTLADVHLRAKWKRVPCLPRDHSNEVHTIDPFWGPANVSL